MSSSADTLSSAREATADSAREATALPSLLLQLSKPGVTRLVMITMLCGALVAPVKIELGTLLLALLGTALVVAGANALNMYIERETDSFMERTCRRPLPSGRLAPDVALWFGIGAAAIGLGLLACGVNWVSTALAAGALLSYVLIYTPLKRFTPYALHVGAVPGALPPVIGWAAVTGRIGTGALVLFALLFVWQLPHFMAISIFRRDDYERAGLKVVPVALGLDAAKVGIVQHALLLLAVSLLPVFTGVGGLVYGVLAGLSGVAFVAYAFKGLAKKSGARWARTLFLSSLPHLVLLYGALVISSLV